MNFGEASARRFPTVKGQTVRYLTYLCCWLLLAACTPADPPVPPEDDVAAPSGLTANPEAGYIRLNWQDNSDNEAGFTLYRSVVTTPEAPLSQLVTLNADVTEFNDVSVRPDARYRYAVAALNEAGSAGERVTQTGQALSPRPPPAAPVVTRFDAAPASGVAPLSVRFSWDMVSSDDVTCQLDIDNDATPDYEVERCSSSAAQEHVYQNEGSFTAALTVSGSETSVRAEIPVTVNAPDLKRVEGQIQAYSGGPAIIKASALDSQGESVVLVQTNLSAEGQFALTLPAALSGALLDTFTDPGDPCLDSSLSIIPADVLTASPRFDYESAGGDGSLVLSTTGDENATVKESLIWLYASKAASIAGTCGAQSYDLTLEAGWNKVVVRDTDDGETLSSEYTSGPLPAGLQWYLLLDGGS